MYDLPATKTTITAKIGTYRQDLKEETSNQNA